MESGSLIRIWKFCVAVLGVFVRISHLQGELERAILGGKPGNTKARRS